MNMNTHNWREIYNKHMTEKCNVADNLVLAPPEKQYRGCYCGDLLEIGCGNGRFSLTLLNDGSIRSATLIDIADVCIEYVKQGLIRWGLRATCIRAAFEEQSFTSRFDVVAFWEGLEHIQRLDPVLRKISSILESGGIFVGSVPDGYTCDHMTHLHHFSQSDLHDLLARYFDTVSVERLDVSADGQIHLTYLCM